MFGELLFNNGMQVCRTNSTPVNKISKCVILVCKYAVHYILLLFLKTTWLKYLNLIRGKPKRNICKVSAFDNTRDAVQTKTGSRVCKQLMLCQEYITYMSNA